MRGKDFSGCNGAYKLEKESAKSSSRTMISIAGLVGIYENVLLVEGCVDGLDVAGRHATIRHIARMPGAFSWG